MAKLNRSSSNYYIFGDFNVNSLRYNNVHNIKSFVDMMQSHSAVNLINLPTWFPRGQQPEAPSLLDHFYTNQVNTVKNIGLLINDISDHLPIVSAISAHAKKIQIEDLHPYIRDFKKNNLEDFNKSLREFKDNQTEHLDIRFEKLNSHIVSCVNKHIPLRKRTKKEKKFAVKPWITNSLKRCI